jgi:hypothetical protein
MLLALQDFSIYAIHTTWTFWCANAVVCSA